MASRLSQMQARFQQKQMQEKEEKMLKFYENQQQRAFERVGRSSAGSNSSVTSTTTTTISHGKVRQLFDERRQKAGIDRSYPLEPINTNRNGNRAASLDRNGRKERKTTTTTTVQKSLKNGKPVLNKREVVNSVYYNNNGEEDGYEERFVDNGDGYLRRDNGDNNRKDDRDLVDMMNRHNLNDSLEDEEMPHIGFDDYEEGIFNGKLANVGGKLPSEAVVVEKEKKPPAKPKAVNGASKFTVTGRVAKVPTANTTRTTTTSNVSPRKPPLRTTTSNTSSPSSSASATSRASPARKPSSASSAGSGSLPSTPVRTVSKPSSVASNRSSPSAAKPRTATPRAAASGNDNDGLSTCKNCQRRFASDRLAVHEKICTKTSKKKRKVYDATKHRFAGTDIEPYVKKSSKPGAASKANAAQAESTKAANTKKPAAASKSNWRQKHEEFINAIRAAKQAQEHIAKGGDIRDLPPPPPSTNPDYVQCPHCNRRFNESAASRHIPKCQNFQFNKPKPNAKTKQPVRNVRK